MFEFVFDEFRGMIIKLQNSFINDSKKNFATGKYFYDIHIYSSNILIAKCWVSIQLLCNSIKTYSIAWNLFYVYDFYGIFFCVIFLTEKKKIK